MNNYELHERAQELADTHSAYKLAKMLILAAQDSAERELESRGPSTTACDDQFAADPNGGDQ